MIVDSLQLQLSELERATGWQIKPEGACKDERCVPLPAGSVTGETVDLRVLGERLGMGLAEDREAGLWALGPESGGRALPSARFPDLALPDRDGKLFSLGSLRGTKFLLLAWASW